MTFLSLSADEAKVCERVTGQRNWTEQLAMQGGVMSAIDNFNRRAFLSTTASLLATGASFMIVPKGYAAPHGGADDHAKERDSEAQPSAVQGGHHTDDEMKKCIQLCQDCHALCTQTIQHCLKLGGRHAAADHIRLLFDCAQLCETTAQYLLRESSFHERLCGFCAEVCRECAENCVQTAGDDQLVKQCGEMCTRCADSCERMAHKVAA